MKINKAIRTAMYKENITLSEMGKSLTKLDKKTNTYISLKPNDISSRLNNTNLTFDIAVQMLDVMGWQIILRSSNEDVEIIVDQR